MDIVLRRYSPPPQPPAQRGRGRAASAAEPGARPAEAALEPDVTPRGRARDDSGSSREPKPKGKEAQAAARTAPAAHAKAPQESQAPQGSTAPAANRGRSQHAKQLQQQQPKEQHQQQPMEEGDDEDATAHDEQPASPGQEGRLGQMLGQGNHSIGWVLRYATANLRNWSRVQQEVLLQQQQQQLQLAQRQLLEQQQGQQGPQRQDSQQQRKRQRNGAEPGPNPSERSSADEQASLAAPEAGPSEPQAHGLPIAAEGQTRRLHAGTDAGADAGVQEPASRSSPAATSSGRQQALQPTSRMRQVRLTGPGGSEPDKGVKGQAISGAGGRKQRPQPSPQASAQHPELSPQTKGKLPQPHPSPLSRGQQPTSPAQSRGQLQPPVPLQEPQAGTEGQSHQQEVEVDVKHQAQQQVSRQGQQQPEAPAHEDQPQGMGPSAAAAGAAAEQAASGAAVPPNPGNREQENQDRQGQGMAEGLGGDGDDQGPGVQSITEVGSPLAAREAGAPVAVAVGSRRRPQDRASMEDDLVAAANALELLMKSGGAADVATGRAAGQGGAAVAAGGSGSGTGGAAAPSGSNRAASGRAAGSSGTGRDSQPSGAGRGPGRGAVGMVTRGGGRLGGRGMRVGGIGPRILRGAIPGELDHGQEDGDVEEGLDDDGGGGGGRSGPPARGPLPTAAGAAARRFAAGPTDSTGGAGVAPEGPVGSLRRSELAPGAGRGAGSPGHGRLRPCAGGTGAPAGVLPPRRPAAAGLRDAGSYPGEHPEALVGMGVDVDDEDPLDEALFGPVPRRPRNAVYCSPLLFEQVMAQRDSGQMVTVAVLSSSQLAQMLHRQQELRQVQMARTQERLLALQQHEQERQLLQHQHQQHLRVGAGLPLHALAQQQVLRRALLLQQQQQQQADEYDAVHSDVAPAVGGRPGGALAAMRRAGLVAAAALPPRAAAVAAAAAVAGDWPSVAEVLASHRGGAVADGYDELATGRAPPPPPTFARSYQEAAAAAAAAKLVAQQQQHQLHQAAALNEAALRLRLGYAGLGGGPVGLGRDGSLLGAAAGAGPLPQQLMLGGAQNQQDLLAAGDAAASKRRGRPPKLVRPTPSSGPPGPIGGGTKRPRSPAAPGGPDDYPPPGPSRRPAGTYGHDGEEDEGEEFEDGPQVVVAPPAALVPERLGGRAPRRVPREDDVDVPMAVAGRSYMQRGPPGRGLARNGSLPYNGPYGYASVAPEDDPLIGGPTIGLRPPAAAPAALAGSELGPGRAPGRNRVPRGPYPGNNWRRSVGFDEAETADDPGAPPHRGLLPDEDPGLRPYDMTEGTAAAATAALRRQLPNGRAAAAAAAASVPMDGGLPSGGGRGRGRQASPAAELGPAGAGIGAGRVVGGGGGPGPAAAGAGAGADEYAPLAEVREVSETDGGRQLSLTFVHSTLGTFAGNLALVPK